MQNIEANEVLEKCIQLDHFRLHLLVIQNQSGQTPIADPFRPTQTPHSAANVIKPFGKPSHATKKVEVYVVDRVDEGHHVEVAVERVDRQEHHVIDDVHIESNKEHLKAEHEARKKKQIGYGEKEEAVCSLFGQRNFFVFSPRKTRHPIVPIRFDRPIVRDPDPLAIQMIIVFGVEVFEGQMDRDQPGGERDALWEQEKSKNRTC